MRVAVLNGSLEIESRSVVAVVSTRIDVFSLVYWQASREPSYNHADDYSTTRFEVTLPCLFPCLFVPIALQF